METLPAASAQVRGGMLRRSARTRRRTRSTFANIVAATTTAATAAISVQDVPITTEYDNVPVEFLTQIEAVPVPVKRKRQRHEDMLNAPLQTKRLGLGKAMMKRDRLLQQKWCKQKSVDAEHNNKVKIMLQEVNGAIEALQENTMQSPSPKEVRLYYKSLLHNVCENQLLIQRM